MGTFLVGTIRGSTNSETLKNPDDWLCSFLNGDEGRRVSARASLLVLLLQLRTDVLEVVGKSVVSYDTNYLATGPKWRK
jgi:hypothetical protein